MLSTIVIVAAVCFVLGSFSMFVLIAPAMLNSRISQEEEVRVNKQLTFANQVIVDAEFEECDDRHSVEPHSSGIVLVAPKSPATAAKAAAGYRKVDLYV